MDTTQSRAKNPSNHDKNPLDQAPADSGAGVFSPNRNLTVSIPRISGKPNIDGLLTEDFWQSAATLDNFCEISPGDNERPKVKTKALFAYDDQNFYIGFICYDSSAHKIRASVTDRDEIFDDDFAGIILDTFLDRQNAWEFFINPYGIQADLRRSHDNEDLSFDTVWESAGRLNAEGWMAEAAIPFRSLRFPDKEEQVWGIHILRIRPRDSREQLSWSPLSRDNACFLCQAGTLKGIKGINGSRNLEILPFAIAKQNAGLSDGDDNRSALVNGKIKGESGIGLKYGITPNLTLDFTVNPDFSQVESDAAQIDVNTTFALFFPEKRPFFLEGGDIFRTETEAVYTRSILDPAAAAKLTGKVGKYTLGYLFALDESSPFTVPFEDHTERDLGGRSTTNVLRLKRDILSDSFLGFLATDRHLADGYNSTAGIDANVRFKDNYRLSGQVLVTRTLEPNDSVLSSEFNSGTFDKGRHTLIFDGEKFDGSSIKANLGREARHFNFSIYYEDLSPTFRAANGFIRRNDFRMGGVWTGVLFQPNNRILEAIQPQFNYGRKKNYEGRLKDKWISPQIFIRFKKQTYLWISYLWSEELFKGAFVDGIRRCEGDISSQFTRILSSGAHWSIGRSVVRDGDAPFTPFLGGEMTYRLWNTFRPTSQLALSSSFTYSRMSDLDTREDIFNGYILRSRMTYQFTKRFYFRLIAQYNDFSREFELDPLFSYKLNPFSVFFIGSTHSVSDFGTLEQFRQTNRQFFIKFQYLFRI